MSYKFDITIDYALPWQPVLDFLIAPTFKMQPYWLKMIILKYKKNIRILMLNEQNKGMYWSEFVSVDN